MQMLGDKRGSECFVKGNWVPFGRKTINDLCELREGRDNKRFLKLKESTNYRKLEEFLTDGKGT